MSTLGCILLILPALTNDTIKNNDYPIISNYYVIKNKKNQSESLNIFTDAVMSDRGKNVIKEAGYIEN